MTTIILNELTPVLRSIYYDARYYCDREGIKDDVGFTNVFSSMVRKSFLEEIKPILKQKSKILTSCLSIKLIYIPDGNGPQCQYDFPSEIQKVLDQADDLIYSIAQKYDLSKVIQ